MRALLRIFLPYSLFFGLAIAIWASNFRPNAQAVVTEASAQVHMVRCDGCAAELSLDRALVGELEGNTYYYCCGHCEKRHQESSHHAPPDETVGRIANLSRHEPPQAKRDADGAVHIDPVCHMEVTPAWGFEVQHKGVSYYFCTANCCDRFAKSPDDFLGDRCIVCNKLNDPRGVTTATYLGKTYRLCSEEHRREFKADPAAFFMHTMWGIPSWMYYLSIAFVLLISFGLFEVWDRLAGGRREINLQQSISAAAVATAYENDRVDLLSNRAFHFLATSRVFRFCCQAGVVALFFLIIAAGLFGNQNPALNIAPILTWTVWWGGLVILIMFAGKAWCYVCPWDAVAGWMEKLRFWKKTEEGLGLNLRWPKALRNIVIATILFVGLTWIELGFGVTMKPRVTAYLAIAMLVMAIVSAFLFERKGFCRYACLVGRVSGLYAMFSGIEVRAKDRSVCRTCPGKECVKGSATAYGCPTFLFPGSLSNNTYCIQCGECLQACPEANLTINLRPWGEDLVNQHRPRTDEAYLALLMLSITGFHGLTMTANWGRLTSWLGSTLSLGNMISFTLGMALLMLAPILVYAVLARISYTMGMQNLTTKRLTYHDYFVRYAYALLPIALFYHLAHNMEHLLMEGPKVVSLASDPFGWGWNLLGTLDWTVPPLVSLDVLWIVQILLVLVGHVYSLWVAGRTSLEIFGERKAAFRSQLPMLAGMICFSVFSLWLLKQPMEMRTSAM